MTVGIDGNQWYCCNGLCLGDPRAAYEFGDTLRQAIDRYNSKHPRDCHRAVSVAAYLDMTVAEYKKVVGETP